MDYEIQDRQCQRAVFKMIHSWSEVGSGLPDSTNNTYRTPIPYQRTEQLAPTAVRETRYINALAMHHFMLHEQVLKEHDRTICYTRGPAGVMPRAEFQRPARPLG